MLAYTFNLPDNSDGTKDIVFTADTATASFAIEAIWDTDTVSDTYNHWVFVVNRVIDDNTAEERAFVLNPNSVYFKDDEIYSMIYKTDNDTITLDNMSDGKLIILMVEENANE